MSIKINHTIFGEDSTSGRKFVYALAIVVVVTASVWLLSPKNDAEHFQTAYDAGNLDQALKIATAISEDAATAADGFRGIAAVRIQKALRGGDVETELALALQAALSAVKVGGPDADSYRILGYIYELQGDREKALSQYRAALEVFPDSAGALYQLGRFLEDAGQKLEAKSYYERAYEADKTNYRASLGLARTLMSEGDTEGAKSWAHQAASSEVPEAVAAANVIGASIHMKNRAYDAAVSAAEVAVEAAPDSVSAILALGEAKHSSLLTFGHLQFTETLEEIRALADKAAGLDPEDPMAPFLAFKATFALGDRASADAYATKTLALLETSSLSETEREGVRAYIDVLRNMKLTPLASR